MKPLTKLLVAVVIGFAIMGGLGFIIRISGVIESTPTPTPTPITSEINISVIVALPVEQWVTEAAETYNSEEHLYEGRKIQVEVIPMPGLKAREKWEGGDFNPVPTVWLAESADWVKQTNIAAAERTGQDIFLERGNYGYERVVRSPLVWGIWPEAYQNLVAEFRTEQISWDEIYKAAVIGDWEEMGGGSGKFKLMIANPKYDPAGLTAIFGAAGEYFDKPFVKTEDLQDREFQKWLCTQLDTVVDFSHFGVKNIILFGRSNGDAAHILESDLLTNMEYIVNHQGESLQIVYPDPIAWFDFPYAIYMGQETSAEEKEAALDFKDYLLTADQQKKALEFGLRPTCVECPPSGGLITDAGTTQTYSSSDKMRDISREDLDALINLFVQNNVCH